MRIGVNPEKNKGTQISYKLHRVIIPVYIPDLKSDYYKNSFEVLKQCINSLIKTISFDRTVITIINNDSHELIKIYLEELLNDKLIDKLINYSANYGKVYPLLSELKASYENYVTIADADVFFMNNWEQEVATIFNNFPKVGFVSPLPCPFNFHQVNKSGVIGNFFKLKLGKVVNDDDLLLFKQGVNPPENFFEGKKWNWFDKQYYLEKNNVKAIVGATHFVATIKNELIRNIPMNGPMFVFRNGDETKHIEKYLDFKGYYRLSTVKTYAYHMGSSVEDWLRNYQFKNISTIFFNSKKESIISGKSFVYYFYAIVFKVLNKNKYNI